MNCQHPRTTAGLDVRIRGMTLLISQQRLGWPEVAGDS